MQVNLPANERHGRVDAIVEFQQSLGVPVILQHEGAGTTSRENTMASSSCSTGRVGEESRRSSLCEHWPERPADGRRYGYAGGIRIENALEAFAFTQRHGEACRTWLDMETHIRTDDYLDLGKVERICRLRCAHGRCEPGG